MKKKLFIIIPIIIVIILIVLGIIKHNSMSNKKVERQLEENEVKIDKTIFRLDQDEERYDILYKVDHRFKKAKLPKYNIYNSSGISNSPYFTIKVYRYINKDLEEVINDTVGDYDKKEKKKINNIEYDLVYSKYLNHNVKTYYYNNNAYIYVYSFTYDKDISKLEKLFLKYIIYNKNTN